MANQLIVKRIDLESGGFNIVVLNEKFAKENNIHEHDRIKIIKGKQGLVVSTNHSKAMVKHDEIGVFEDTARKLKLKNKQKVKYEHIRKPKSLNYIKKKLDGEELTKKEIKEIVKNIVDNTLSQVELTFFVAGIHTKELTSDETKYLTQAIVETGKTLKLNKKIILDKHSIGGICGNRTTPIIVSILASLGYTIPKTSSKAITSPAGTADTMQVFCSVSHPINKLKEIIKKTNACLAWGGAVEMAAADDKLIKIRVPLRLDPWGLLLSSVMAKKLAVGATHLIVDIPIGEEAKIKSLGEANHLKRMFEILGEKLGIKTIAWVSDGSQPIGNGIGPCLEARDILLVLENKGPKDLKEKSLTMAGMLLDFVKGGKRGYDIAKRALESGKALKKFKEIIKAQGGNQDIKPKDIITGKFKWDYISKKGGTITKIRNRRMAKMARAAGAPADKAAGVYLNYHVNSGIKKNDVLFTIYSDNKFKLSKAVEIAKEEPVIIIVK